MFPLVLELNFFFFRTYVFESLMTAARRARQAELSASRRGAEGSGNSGGASEEVSTASASGSRKRSNIAISAVILIATATVISDAQLSLCANLQQIAKLRIRTGKSSLTNTSAYSRHPTS